MQEIKIYLDEPYLAAFKAEAAREGRSLRQHGRRAIEERYEEPVKRTARPKAIRFKTPSISKDGVETYDLAAED